MVATMTPPQITRCDNRLEQLRQRSSLSYSRNLLLSQDPYADADRAWEQMYENMLKSSESTTALKDNPADEWKQPAQQPPLPPNPVQQAREFYDTELRSQMETLYDGQYVAIHPQTRSYSVQQWSGKAFRALRMQQPLGPIVVHNIGFADFGLKARLRGEQP